MSKISKEAAAAFHANKPYKNNNTEVVVSGAVTEMFLFGNLIAWKDAFEMCVTFAGWPTRTTMDRLKTLGVSCYTSKGCHYINGMEVGVREVIKIKP